MKYVRYLAVALIFGLHICAAGYAALAKTEGIAAVVNDGVVSMTDLTDRLRLVMISSGLPDTPEIREKLSAQVMSALIEEKIKVQEAERLGLEVTDEDVQNGFATIAQQNKMEAAQFEQVLQQSGINIATMYQQIRAQIAWTKVVQSQLRPRIVVTDADIEEELNRLNRNIGKTEYLVAEIALPVESAEAENKVKKLAENLIGEMRAGKAPFFKVAQQFSKAPGAPQGGDLGWIGAGQLPEELDQVLKTMEQGAISAPIRAVDGYHILLLRETREITPETIPSRDDIMSSIGLQRLERAQRRHYMDLRSAAFVETRV